MICAEGYEISDIDDYGDWAEYQYDIRGNEVYFRRLEGSWPESARTELTNVEPLGILLEQPPSAQ